MDNSPLSAPRTKKITAVYFSPTGTSKRIARAIAGAMATALNMETADFPLTLPADRKNLLPEFGEGDVLVLALPVYAGRVPAIAEPIIKKLSGRGTPDVFPPEKQFSGDGVSGKFCMADLGKPRRADENRFAPPVLCAPCTPRRTALRELGKCAP